MPATLTPEEVREALRELGLSGRTAAARLGVSAVTVSAWGTGRHPVPAWAVAFLATLRQQRQLRAALAATLPLLEGFEEDYDDMEPEEEPIVRPVVAQVRAALEATDSQEETL